MFSKANLRNSWDKSLVFSQLMIPVESHFKRFPVRDVKRECHSARAPAALHSARVKLV